MSIFVKLCRSIKISVGMEPVLKISYLRRDRGQKIKVDI